MDHNVADSEQGMGQPQGTEVTALEQVIRIKPWTRAKRLVRGSFT